jgi:hypothetical protein
MKLETLLTLDLEKATELYIKKKSELDKTVREYENARAKAQLAVDTQSMRDAASREANVILSLEVKHADLLNKLYNLRGECRALMLIRQLRLEQNKYHHIMLKRTTT